MVGTDCLDKGFDTDPWCMSPEFMKELKDPKANNTIGLEGCRPQKSALDVTGIGPDIGKDKGMNFGAYRTQVQLAVERRKIIETRTVERDSVDNILLTS